MITSTLLKRALRGLVVGFAGVVFLPSLFAHCDTLDGPVVTAGRCALEERNVNLALIWVQKADETEIVRGFEHALAVRKLGAEARQLADRFFLETLVRVHRAGEGAPFTGLKPAGGDLGPAVPAGDKAIETGDVEPLARLLASDLHRGLEVQFKAVLSRRKFRANDVPAGREYVRAYVSYIHYVEALHAAMNTAAHAHRAEPQAHH